MLFLKHAFSPIDTINNNTVYYIYVHSYNLPAKHLQHQLLSLFSIASQ